MQDLSASADGKADGARVWLVSWAPVAGRKVNVRSAARRKIWGCFRQALGKTIMLLQNSLDNS
jgi:hypothetical protein